MGFDEETKEGHRIYWPGKRSISVEMSDRFNVEQDEVVVGALLLKGENEVGKRLTTIESKKHDANDLTHDINNQTSDVETPDPVPEVVEGQGKRIRKETKYVRKLKDGSGITGSRGGGTLPRGMQPRTTIDYAMVAVMSSAEGLKPSYEEAQKCP